MQKGADVQRGARRRPGAYGDGLVLPRSVIIFALSIVMAACGKSKEVGREPPPPTSAGRAGTCSAGGGALRDGPSAPFFPTITATFCLDPNGGDRAFGEGASLPLDRVCELFDRECDLYKGHGVRRVSAVRYVDGSGGPAAIEVRLSRFATTEGAYGLFTRRVVGDGDPAGDSAPRPIEGGGAAALGAGSAYLWRGLYVAEVGYSDPSAAATAIKAAGDQVLPPLVKEIGERLPGETPLPPAAAELPGADRLPLGLRYAPKDALGIEGLGSAAFGYYRAGAKRWRVASMVRADGDQAKDLLGALAGQAGASKEKRLGEVVVRLMRGEGEGPPAEWLFKRSGARVVGVGDEPRALRASMSNEERDQRCLTREEKLGRLDLAAR